MRTKNIAVRSRKKNKQRIEDRIGQLPDDVIGAIFRHLSMEEAGRTSVLSHRWKNLWKLTPHLNFDTSRRIWPIWGCLEAARVHESERRKYISWVEQLVENHSGSDLCELVLDFPFLDARHSSHVDKWIGFALRKRVKAIKIILFEKFIGSSGQSYSFLKTAPAIPGVECLTSLCLKYVDVDVSGEMIERLLSVCPLLERLSLAESTQISDLRIVGASLRLRHLDIYYCAPLESFDISAPNLVSLYFYRTPGTVTKLKVDGISSLVDLCIGGVDINHEWMQFSGYFPQLATLGLRFNDNESFFEEHRLPHQLTNLRHLSIRILCFDNEWMALIFDFINLYCPLLHKFTLELPPDFGVVDDEEDEVSDEEEEEETREWIMQISPHQCLKVVELLHYSSQIEIVEYILNYAIKLEKLIIDPRWQS